MLRRVASGRCVGSNRIWLGRGRPALVLQQLHVQADVDGVFEFRRRAGNVGNIAGSGVGLASARRIVERHGGAITVESIEGIGSTFTIVLPLGQPTP